MKSSIKISKTVHDNNEIITTEYLDGFQYIDEDLQFFPTSEGYVRKTDGTNRKWFDYVFNYTDHLGNIRLSYTKDPLPGNESNLKILEENNYYPFGLKHGLYNKPARDFRPVIDNREIEMVNDNPYNYKYNGQEWQGELGLNVTSMDFRQYDNALGRFMNPDALSELAPMHTPYRFGFNNPVFWSDPTGLFEGSESMESFRYCPTCPESDNFDEFRDDPNTNYVYNDETGVVTEVIELPDVVADSKSSGTQSNNKDWWVVNGLPNRNANFDRPFNIALGAYGAFSTTTEAWLHGERKALEKKGTKTAAKKIDKYVKPSIDKINKVSKRLGVAGAAYSAGSLGYDIVSGQEVTAGQVFDVALTVGLSFVAISNPIGLIVLGTYTVIDMYGGFDGIKESLGMDYVIINN